MKIGSHDVLSRILSACKADRAVTASFQLRAPWALRSVGTEGALIRLCTEQAYWIQVEDGPATEIGPYDIVMLPRGTPHVISSAPVAWEAAQPFADVLKSHMTGNHGDHPIEMTYGGDGPVTQLYTLHLWMPALEIGTVPALLPSLAVLRKDEIPLAGALGSTMESLVRDSLARRPGWQLSAARMGDLLLVHILGEYLRQPAHAKRDNPNLLDDPGIARAVAAIQNAPQRAWTIPLLASAAYMSRTVFAERFRALVGVPPMQYLGAYRMNLATEQLRNPRARIADVAEAVGYTSEKAFSRAFQRWIGVSPNQYQHQQPGAT